ncbi:MAG: GNAT family N-acetyltransferase [Ilumatobacteraceae bacterium]
MLIRSLTDADLPAALTLNNASVPAVNELDETAARILLGMSHEALVAEVDGSFAGFCWCMGPGHPYESLNYQWFSARYDDFSYLDRIAVHPDFRRHGVGRGLYGELQHRLAGRHPVLLCEVNVRPANDASLRLHASLGFEEVGQQDTDGGTKTVSLLALRLTAAQDG